MAAFNDNHIQTFKPLRGGIAIVNPNVNEIGTLGFVATSDGADRWIVSCYHVLCRNHGRVFPAGTIEPIVLPFGVTNEVVAQVTDALVSREFDCAAALVPSRQAIGRILGIGRLTLPAEPQQGHRVIKSGAATGITEGKIVRVSSQEVDVGLLESPDGYELSKGGDSGALWIDADTYAPVALHLGGNARGQAESVQAVPLRLVLEVIQPLRILVD
jgi:hypothetical protein